MKIALVTSDSFLQNKIFDPNSRDLVSRKFCYLRELFKKNNIETNTYDITKLEDASLAIHFDIHKKALRGKKSPLNILIVQESPIINKQNMVYERKKYFDRVLTWEIEKIDNKKNYWIGCGSSAEIKNIKVDEIINMKSKKICLIGSKKYSNIKNELYSSREYYLKKFANSKNGIDLYGYGWDKRVFRGFLRPLNKIDLAKKIFFEIDKNYYGSILNKYEILKKYKFSLCFENCQNSKGYISEKIFDSLFSMTIPIYDGFSDLKRFIPQDIFINIKDFKSYNHLNEYINSISNKVFQEKIEQIIDFYPKYKESSFYDLKWAEEIYNHSIKLINND